jgi:hypothetical protein
MPKTKARRPLDGLIPRGMNEQQTATYIGRSLNWFLQHKTELIEAGFPPKVPIIDLYDRVAIDDWLDRQNDPDERLRRDWSAQWQKATVNG